MTIEKMKYEKHHFLIFKGARLQCFKEKERQLSGFFVIQSFFTQINDIQLYYTAVTTFSWTLLKIMMIMTIFDDDAKKAI